MQAENEKINLVETLLQGINYTFWSVVIGLITLCFVTSCIDSEKHELALKSCAITLKELNQSDKIEHCLNK